MCLNEEVFKTSLVFKQGFTRAGWINCLTVFSTYVCLDLKMAAYWSILFIYLLSMETCAASVLSTFSMLKESPRKPDINELLPFFQFLHKPKPNEKNEAKLLFQLGKNYDPEYTSILEPRSYQARDPSKLKFGHKETNDVMKNNPIMSDELKNMKFIVKKIERKEERIWSEDNTKDTALVMELIEVPCAL